MRRAGALRLRRSTQDGVEHTGTNRQALAAEVTDARVATVTLVSPGVPNVTASPVAGSVVVTGLGADRPGSGRARPVVGDASGAVLEEPPWPP